MIDTHCHLDDKCYKENQAEIITRAFENGITHIINVGIDLKTSENSIQLAEKYPQIYASVGIHPHNNKVDKNFDKIILDMTKLKKVVAIGEIGLDFYKNYSPKDKQIELFKRQISIAKEIDLPIIIHSRNAFTEILEILDKENVKNKIIFHFFSGDVQIAKKLVSLGYYISIAGPITFENEILEEVIKKISIDNILVETDSPYAAPVPMRGKCNEPSYLKYIVHKIADIANLSCDDIIRITTLNTKRIFDKIEIENFLAKIAYPIRNSLYLNITNRCTNKCSFCVKYQTDYVKGHNLKLSSEPSEKEILDNIFSLPKYDEIVFCGYGEPLIRLDIVKNIAKNLKLKGFKLRINTNGQANLIHKRNILPELKDLIDVISISLNTHNEELYNKLCNPIFGEHTYDKIKEFVIESKKYIPEVFITVIDIKETDLKKCEEIAQNLGVKLRIRKYNEPG